MLGADPHADAGLQVRLTATAYNLRRIMVVVRAQAARSAVESARSRRSGSPVTQNQLAAATRAGLIVLRT